MINIHRYETVENEHLYGPGKRLLIFTQGCSLHCNGCVNQHLWGFGKGNDVSAEDILKQCASLDGITLHGGEPLDQAKDLREIVDVVKKHGKTVLLFTGYTYKELNETQRWIWLNSDIVVSGRYDEAKRNIYLQFRGSTNQKVYVHQGKYKDYKIKDGQTVAILSFSEDGEMRVRGFQNDELNKLLKDIKSKDE
jgi:anaerobic ribonucleoside-triphosphate reductase activating protein